jgi:aryl-alcohol dehydrogenase-like predicted oxidoreductase
MERRTFVTSAALGGALPSSPPAAALPAATLGKTGLKVTRLAVGGYHMAVRGEQEALRILRRAFDLGLNFFDSANSYHNGLSDEILGKAFSGADRQKVIFMTKCEVYTRDGALRVLEQQLRRLRTDAIDLWQCHQVGEHSEVDRILGPAGALEAFVLAKKQGKVRHIGFTGHRDPEIHLRLLAAADVWETLQMPVNLVDPHYLSFLRQVLPEARRRGLGVIAMKSNAMGQITTQGVAAIGECLRFAWSQDIDVLVSGVETVEQLEHNAAALRAFRPMQPQEISALLERTAQGRTGPGVERYKRPPRQARLTPRPAGPMA